MNCEHIREQLVETARGRELSSDLRAIVFSHAANCSGCAQHLESERSLTVALSEVALATEHAPVRAEEFLRGRLPVPIRPARAARFTWAWGAAAAMAAGLALAALWTPMEGTGSPVVPSAPAPVEQASVPADEDEFMPLPYVDAVAKNEPADIVRVAMSRESLLAMGVPVSPDRFGEQIEADVLIGVDGTARAIRISD